MEIIAQILGIIAMCLNVAVFVMKKQKTMIIIQFIASVLFATNMLLLGALSGGLMNGAAIVRGIVFMNKRRLGNRKWLFTGGLIGIYIVLYILGFAVFGKSAEVRNIIIEFLPLFAMIMMTIGFAADSARKTRIFGLINSPPWLVYNIINFNVGGIICEIFCMISVVCGMIRYDRKGVDKNGTV